MREISYHKDYRHNYLIIREDEMTGDDYQRKMITENRIRGLLPCQIRYINGETLLYYEITSKQSVKGLFEGKHLTMKELKGLFISLKMENGILMLITGKLLLMKMEKKKFITLSSRSVLLPKRPHFSNMIRNKIRLMFVLMR